MAKQMILGGGVTGLAAAIASGSHVYEATDAPGGICCSYYLAKGQSVPSHQPSDDAYRFEIGGGHWIFGGDPAVLRFIRSLTPTASYSRFSGVWLPEEKTYTPFPIQNHLKHLGSERASRALSEMANPRGEQSTLKDWLRRSFGNTLFDLFFDGFNRLYTAGLYDRISPQDAYKSPVDLSLAIRGALEDVPAVGYNTQYLYPIEGLGTLASRMSAQCNVHYGKRVVRIDAKDRAVHFSDGDSMKYSRLLSTLPLDKTLELAQLTVPQKADPYTSVLVVNIGAVKADNCPADHWIYVPTSDAGFHRVGFYSNVTADFLPRANREKNDRVSIYVERAYVGGERPSDAQINHYCDATVRELQQWGWIADAEVVHPTWIDSAYTWAWPGSKWRGAAMSELERNDIIPVGRYARWVFQGIADSIRDGFIVGSSLRES
jgi:protoporphyrinogen oxidase